MECKYPVNPRKHLQCTVCQFRQPVTPLIFFRIACFLYTQPVWTLFLFKSIWTRPQGSQGCQKIRFIFLQIKLLSFCANIAPERHKLRKIFKIGKKCQKIPVFIDFFKYSSILGQYQGTKPQMACLVDSGTSFDTPGTPGGIHIDLNKNSV